MWKPALIVSKATGPRSYVIREENGRIVTRNAIHLRQSYNVPNFKSDYYDLFDEENVGPNQQNVNLVQPNVNNQPVPVQPNVNLNVPVQNYENVYHTRSGRPVRCPARYQ